MDNKNKTKIDLMDQVTVKVDYDRPKFVFENFEGEGGNSSVYWKNVIEFLRFCGFKKESSYIHRYDTKTFFGTLYLPKLEFKDQFNYISRFVDFSDDSKKQVDNGGGCTIVEKDKKLIRQDPLFMDISLRNLGILIKEGKDFSVLNCYNRTIFNYIDREEDLRFMLEENRKHGWVDLFATDHFGGSILHSCSGLGGLNVILEEMFRLDKERARELFFKVDVFNRSGFSVLLLEMEHVFNFVYDLRGINFKKMGRSIGFVKLMDEDRYVELLDSIRVHPLLKNNNENNRKFVEYMLLSNSIIKNERTIMRDKI